jgi:hypothetical protein
MTNQPAANGEPNTLKGAWLEAFEKRGTVVAACKTAGVGRTTAYEWRQKDEAFALAWADIEEATTEAMEREAFRRGVEGTVEPLVSAGKHVTDVKKYSDTLLIFMLKARRPEKYRDNIKVEHAGKVETVSTSIITDADFAREARDLLRRAAPSSSD